MLVVSRACVISMFTSSMFKFPADSAEQLAQTLNRLQHAESVSEGALKTYQENFTAEANYRQLMAIYSKAMQKSGERNEPSCG